jgi:hypothetical protein
MFKGFFRDPSGDVNFLFFPNVKVSKGCSGGEKGTKGLKDLSAVDSMLGRDEREKRLTWLFDFNLLLLRQGNLRVP